MISQSIDKSTVQPKTQSQASRTWEKSTAQAQVGDFFRLPHTPIMQVVERDQLEAGRVRLLLKPLTASHSEEWILNLEPAQRQQTAVTPQQPALVAVQTKPKLKPAPQPPKPPEPLKTKTLAKLAAPEWTTTYNSRWDWYEVWVGDKWAGRAATSEEAERIAQQYIALDEAIERQNAAVLAAYGY